MPNGDPIQIVTPPTYDRDKLVRMFFSLMALHEHTFKVKDVSPNVISGRYRAMLGELRELLPDPLADEAGRLFVFDDEDANLSEIQTEAASMLGWLNGVLVTAGALNPQRTPQLPPQLMHEDPSAGGPGQYL